MRLAKGFCQLTLVFLVALLLYAPQAAAQEARFRLGQRSYTIAGKSYAMDAAPYVAAGRTYVPVRYLALALGTPEAGIRWDGTTRTVTLQKEDVTLRLRVGSTVMEISAGGGVPVCLLMEVAPQVKAGRLYLPARYVAAGLGYSAAWEPATRSVVLQPGEVPVVKELRFDPNPVAPEKGLITVVKLGGPAAGAPVVQLRGVGARHRKSCSTGTGETLTTQLSVRLVLANGAWAA
jgi:hypothetical protein